MSVVRDIRCFGIFHEAGEMRRSGVHVPLPMPSWQGVEGDRVTGLSKTDWMPKPNCVRARMVGVKDPNLHGLR